MHYTFQQRLAHVLRAILAWTVAYALFGMFRLYGVGELPHVILIEEINLTAFIAQLFLAAVITGVLYGMVDILLDRPKVQRLPYGLILSMRVLSHSVIVLVVLVALLYSRVRAGYYHGKLFRSGAKAKAGRDHLQ